MDSVRFTEPSLLDAVTSTLVFPSVMLFPDTICMTPCIGLFVSGTTVADMSSLVVTVTTTSDSEATV